MVGVDVLLRSRRRFELVLRVFYGSFFELFNYKEGLLKVRFLKRFFFFVGKENLNFDDVCGYMDMSGMFEDERVILKFRDEVEFLDFFQKMYIRLSSVFLVVESRFFRSVFYYFFSLSDIFSSVVSIFVREENYLFMYYLISQKKLVFENIKFLKSYVYNV